MNEKQRYRQIAKVKAEFNRLFSGQEAEFSKDIWDGERDTFVSVYPTGGVCVKNEETYAFFEKMMHFYTPDLRLICREYWFKDMVSNEHTRALYNETRDIIWCAQRLNLYIDLYLPKGNCGFWKYTKFLLYDLLSGRKYRTAVKDPKPSFRSHSLTTEQLKAIQKKYQVIKTLE